jgi:DNA-binding MarR family transcriptional regulator
MFRILVASSGGRAASLGRRGLTPNDARALWSLESGAGRPIGDLAREWSCDPSNATFIVNRLEKAGFAKRRALASDGRVKLVTLTPAGAAVRNELEKEYHRPPPEITGLDERDLKALTRILAKAVKDDL